MTKKAFIFGKIPQTTLRGEVCVATLMHFPFDLAQLWEVVGLVRLAKRWMHQAGLLATRPYCQAADDRRGGGGGCCSAPMLTL